MNPTDSAAPSEPAKPQRPRIYVAGPEVFARDRGNIFQFIQTLAEERELEVLLPLADPEATSQEIFAANVYLMQQADGAIASLRPHNGLVEPDSGTVWETGYLFARGKPVVGYYHGFLVPHHTQAEKIRYSWRQLGATVSPSQLTMPNGDMVEDFGLPLNLQLFHSLTDLTDTVTEAMDRICELLYPE